MVKLNTTQQEILNEIKAQGFATLNTFKKHYTSPITQKANIEMFILNEIIKEEVDGEFEYCGEKNE